MHASPLEWSHSPCTDIGCWEGHWYASEQELHQATAGRRKGQLDTILQIDSEDGEKTIRSLDKKYQRGEGLGRM
jgi:hypothetical protein